MLLRNSYCYFACRQIYHRTADRITFQYDSPLKAYAQKESADNLDRDIPPATVNASFYGWLSRFKGPGQIIVLENEAVDPTTARALNAIQFTDDNTHGRQGFYPPRTVIAPPPAPASDGTEFDDLA